MIILLYILVSWILTYIITEICFKIWDSGFIIKELFDGKGFSKDKLYSFLRIFYLSPVYLLFLISMKLSSK